MVLAGSQAFGQGCESPVYSAGIELRRELEAAPRTALVAPFRLRSLVPALPRPLNLLRLRQLVEVAAQFAPHGPLRAALTVSPQSHATNRLDAPLVTHVSLSSVYSGLRQSRTVVSSVKGSNSLTIQARHQRHHKPPTRRPMLSS